MDIGLKSSSILLIKSKFFIYRVLSYFSFILIPVWIQKTTDLNQALQCLLMLFYIGFMIGQWFLLGKEIDYRLKIYFLVNSSIDRVVYRMFLGMIVFVLYFNVLSFLPPKWIYNLFWVTWILLGLFYSWPTRGKIIRESVSSSLLEFRYLDSFEKTLLILIGLMFIVSVPKLPTFVSFEALKLYFDPLEKYSVQLWNFLNINYYPFKRYPNLFRIAWCMHFYVVCMGSFLLVFYALLRFFMSRRLSILGVFAILSSWSFVKFMSIDFGLTMTTTFSVLWVWTLLWVTKSSTYRSGLFVGLMGYWGVIINQSFFMLIFLQLFMLYFLFQKNRTHWFRRQFVRYAFFGFCLVVLTYVFQHESSEMIHNQFSDLLQSLGDVLSRKAFYSLSVLGLVIFLGKFFKVKIALMNMVRIDQEKVVQLLWSLVILMVYPLVFDGDTFTAYALMWPITLLSLVPLEIIFQSIRRLRSSRNMIYLVYIIICLLDSHFEGRVKIFLNLFHS